MLEEIERRRKMFHWFVDGLGSFHVTPNMELIWISRHGLNWKIYDYLTPDWVEKHYNINFD
jgi:hypothetical protein